MSSFQEKLEQRTKTRETMAARRQPKEFSAEDGYIEQMVAAAKASNEAKGRDR